MFEWDEDKRRVTLETRGLDFTDAIELFDGRPVITTRSMRGSEERFVTTSLIGGLFFTTVWTLRGDNVRIISFKRSRDAEKRAYRQVHS